MHHGAVFIQDTSLYSHTSSSSTSPHTLSLDFTASHLQFFLSCSWLLQSPRYLHLLQTRQFFFSHFHCKVIRFQTGIKVFKLLYNSYVALFKCSLSLLDEKLCDFMLSKNTRQQYVFIFRCLLFLKFLRGLPLFFTLFVNQTYSSLGTK